MRDGDFSMNAEREEIIKMQQERASDSSPAPGSAASSNYCFRPAHIRPGMTGRDLLKIAHGGEELGPHEYVSGICKHCGQPEPQNESSSPTAADGSGGAERKHGN